MDKDKLTDVVKTFNPKKCLNPKIFPNDLINSRVRLRLLDIADDFIESLNIKWLKPKDIILTGSLCNYNWSQYSDFDLHIVVDFKDVDENTEFVKEYFDSKKKLWNNDHPHLTIYGYPVEVYVQDESEEHESTGVYSLEKNEWITHPYRANFETAKLNRGYLEYIVFKIIRKIETLQETIYSETDKVKLEAAAESCDKLFSTIREIRKNGLEKDGEMSIGNIIFKTLRRTGHIGILVDLLSKSYDKINSI